ncbi:MAG: 4Fe-4S binding protein [Elusimicrobiota bacterium]|jgi:ferredoxin|nr:4Fe-4S binding protein [Elusimicrobiota bacterium]
MKKLRIIVQILTFIFITASFILLSFPLKFFKTESFFLTSPVFPLLASISAVKFFPHIVISLFFIAAALIFGRLFCGWICPFGAIMDFAAFIMRPFKKWKENEPAKPLLSKYILLAVFVIFAIFGLQIVWIFEPVTVFSRFIMLFSFPFANEYSDKLFQYLIMNFNIGNDLYYFFQNDIFDAKQTRFNYSFIYFVLFIIPLVLIAYKRRFWCRYICPLGACFGLASIKPIFGLKAKKCANACGRCRDLCPTNAIRKDGTIISSECIMCLSCLNLQCRKPQEKEITIEDDKKGITRKDFLYWGGGIISALIIFTRKSMPFSKNKSKSIIRPPGALEGNAFNQACARCGNCMKVCVTNGLQPAGFEAGLDGLWTPKFDYIIGYCEYECNACGKVCPIQAIKNLELDEKKKIKMGLAEVDKKLCIPWSTGTACLVCEEMCPIPTKAIKMQSQKINGITVLCPTVDRDLCVGCGICQNKCPVEGIVKGIQVYNLQ